MSREIVTTGIILTRTDYLEADRILTYLTPDYGKVKAIAKSVRKNKSKLAGSIELFSISEITVIGGKGEINTLISSRLIKHYGEIIKDYNRTTTAYNVMKTTNKAIEDAAESGYYDLLEKSLDALNDNKIDSDLIGLWFEMQLLKLSGHAPNLQTDINGEKLKQADAYNFYMDHMRFAPKRDKQGKYSDNHIKFLRIGFASPKPDLLSRINNLDPLIKTSQPLVQTMLRSYIRI